MTTQWWAAFGPADTEVACGDGTHRLQWTDGTLRAVAHPDAEGELVLAALGGDATPCLDLVRAWGQHSDDLTALAIGPRSADDKLTITPAALDELLAETGSHLPGARFRRPRGVGGGGFYTVSPGTMARRRAQVTATVSAVRARGKRVANLGSAGGSSLVHGWAGPSLGADPDDPRTALLYLLALGTPFQIRLCGTVAHAWSADGKHADRRGSAGPALTAALAGRLAPVAARWLGIDPGQVDAGIHDGDGWGEVSWTRSHGEERLRVALPVGWLARVWAPGLALVGRHLVVDVQDAAWPTARVFALPTPGGQLAELSVRHDGQGWIAE